MKNYKDTLTTGFDKLTSNIDKDEIIDKLNELILLTQSKVNNIPLIKKEEPAPEPKKCCKSKCCKAFKIIAIIAVVAGIGYAVYKYLNPDYVDDFEDEEEE